MEPPKICIQGADGEELDKYTEGIEVSNACRNFYVSRLKTAEGMKKKLSTVPPSLGHTPLDKSMDVLRREMSSLIDQDLSLMRQLLTLNEQIEELKWQRKLKGYSRSSEFSMSSCNVENSAYTLGSDLDCAASREVFPYKYPSPSKLSLLEECYSTTESLSVQVPAPETASSHSLIDSTSCQERLQLSNCVSQTKDTSRSNGSTSDLGSYDDLMPPTSSDFAKSGRQGTDSAYSTCDDAKCKNGVEKIRRESEERADDCGSSSTLDSKRDSKGQQSFDSGIQESTT